MVSWAHSYLSWNDGEHLPEVSCQFLNARFSVFLQQILYLSQLAIDNYDPFSECVSKTLFKRDRRLHLKPPLIHDTDYMVEKTYHLAQYLSPLGPTLFLSNPYRVQHDHWTDHDPKRFYDCENIHFSTIFGRFGGLFNASVTHRGFKMIFGKGSISLRLAQKGPSDP